MLKVNSDTKKKDLTFFGFTNSHNFKFKITIDYIEHLEKIFKLSFRLRA